MLVFTDRIAAALIVRLNHFAGDGIDELLAEAVAGFPVHLPKLGCGDRRIKRNGATDERYSEIALPMRTGGHKPTPHKNRLGIGPSQIIVRLNFLSRINGLSRK